ncbi:MAG: VWA domain-containing protein [Chloroflexales bacterium]
MQRRLFPTAVLVLLVAMLLIFASALMRARVAPTPGSAARVTQVETSAYPAISLYVAVTDANGQPRLGLRQNDFAITEDGAPVALTAFSGAGASQVTSVLVLDRSGSMADNNKIAAAQAAATAFVGLLRPSDRIALIAFNETVQVAQTFTKDVTVLNHAISDLKPADGTALYDAIVRGVDLLRNEPGRRLLLVLSDGQDMRETGQRSYGSQHTLAEAIAYAEAAGQPVAVVGLGDRTGAGIDEAVLQQIATATGGRYLYAPQGEALTALYTSLAGEVQHEYQLTYVSPRPFYDGTRRDLRVQAGASTAVGGYTEQHLINVAANPLVGVALLLPLAGLLVLPGVWRRRTSGGKVPPAEAVPTPPFTQPAPQIDTVLETPVAAAATIAMPASPPTVDTSARRCVHCKAPLRATARFCTKCGTNQPVVPAPPTERRTFCDMCGSPLEPGAKFCLSCGEPVGERRQI